MTGGKILIDRAVVASAVEALTNCYSTHGHRCNRCDSEVDEGGNVAAALRAALEQPQVEQEPVAWSDEIIDCLQAQYNTDMIEELESGDSLIRLDDAIAAVEEAEQRYTHPQPPRQPLTEDEINTIWRNSTHMTIVEVVRAIEAAHGIGGEA